jgi:hypothetical protein
VVYVTERMASGTLREMLAPCSTWISRWRSASASGGAGGLQPERDSHPDMIAAL